MTSHTTWKEEWSELFLSKAMKIEFRKPRTIQWIKIGQTLLREQKWAESPERTIEEHNPVLAEASPVGNSYNPPPGHHYHSQLFPVQSPHP